MIRGESSWFDQEGEKIKLKRLGYLVRFWKVGQTNNFSWSLLVYRLPYIVIISKLIFQIITIK